MDELSRRSFLKRSSGAAAGGSAFTIVRPELVRGAGGERLKLGVVGCGGRSTYILPHLFAGTDNVDVVAMADLYEDQLERCLARLRQDPKFGARMKVDAEHRFTGWDAYRKLLASDIDLVLLAVPPVFRPAHFEAAVEAKKHIFAEKPLGVDPVGLRRLMAAAKKSESLKLSVGIGAQRRSAPDYRQTIDKIRGGAIGDVVAAYAYWLGPPAIKLEHPKPGMGPVEFQIRNWYSYRWLSGDQVVEQHIHNIDVINWVMGTHPVKVVASGGVAWRPRTETHGNIYDHLSADFEYANGVRLSSYCRHYPKEMTGKVGELVVGTRGRSNCHDLAGEPAVPSTVQQFTDLVKSIRGEGPYVNRAMPVAESTMTAVMARESAYSGMEITWEQIMASQQDLLPRALDRNPAPDTLEPPVPGRYKFV